MTRYFVFDTNALISAQLKEGSVSTQAFDKAIATGTIVCSSSILEEFATRFVRRKFKKYMPDEDRVEAIGRVKRISLFIEPTIDIKACRDPDDDKFLSLAIAIKANCIVTGDGKLQELHPFRGIPIVSPADFLKMF